MTICLGKGCSFDLPRMPFVNCCQVYVFSLVLRAGCGIRSYRFLVIAYLFTLYKVTNIKNLLTMSQDYANIKSEMRSIKSNENIHKKEGGSYYVVSANKASSVTL